MNIYKIISIVAFATIGIWSGGTMASLHAVADGQTPQVSTRNFEIFTDFDDEKALELAANLSQLHSLYNQLFNFNLDLNEQDKLTVRYFATKSTFDFYLTRVLGRTYPHFVFLDYEDSSDNELILYEQEGDFDRALAHFAFIQFLKTHVPMVPAWIQEGYALYFENITFDDQQGSIIFQENDRWLEPLKEIITNSQLIELNRFLRMSEEQARDEKAIFYPQAWGMVSFLISYRSRGQDRVAQEVNAALRANGSTQSNTSDAYDVLKASFSDFSILEADFRAYILSKESINSLLAKAVEHYNAKQFGDAERVLYSAISIDEDNPTPYYYLGLIHYDRGDYNVADHYYVQSLIRGAPEGTVYYALGLNALASEDRSRALNYFDQARTIDPTLFGKIDSALTRTY